MVRVMDCMKQKNQSELAYLTDFLLLRVEDGIDCATLVFPLRLPRRRYQASLRNKLLRNIFCPPCPPPVCKHTRCKKNKRCRFRHLIASFAWVEDGIRTHDLLSPINQPLSYTVLSDVCIFVCTNKDTN